MTLIILFEDRLQRFGILWDPCGPQACAIRWNICESFNQWSCRLIHGVNRLIIHIKQFSIAFNCQFIAFFVIHGTIRLIVDMH